MASLVIVLGDQLDQESVALARADRAQDTVFMAEVTYESTKVWVNKPRIAMFLSAMRHFRDWLKAQGWQVCYHELGTHETLKAALAATIKDLAPDRLVMVEAGEYQIEQGIKALARQMALPLEYLADTHFYTTRKQFSDYAKDRKSLIMEYFYRQIRKRDHILVDGAQPVGGKWNFDQSNRGSFGKAGPDPERPRARRFAPDETTKAVFAAIEQHFPDHPGSLALFDWPVTATQAQQALDDFIEHRLPHFGKYQDAMWTDSPYLYHARLSAAMNLKLLPARQVVAAAIAAYHDGAAEIAAVEGFVRQIVGWREFVRGLYWHYMPQWLDWNHLDAQHDLPAFYWTGKTEMVCLAQAISQTLEHGYAHHIQRLMVTGLFAMLLGVKPSAVHAWYLAVYVDAVEWVELPNTIGMATFADGGVMGTKPYAASGNYINKMSNYCQQCKFNHRDATGDQACPFTTLYWDFLDRNRDKLASNRRMNFALANLKRKDERELAAIRSRAAALIAQLSPG